MKLVVRSSRGGLADQSLRTKLIVSGGKQMGLDS